MATDQSALEQRLHTSLWPLVKHCITNKNLMLYGGIVCARDLKCSAPGSTHQSNCDRFVLSLPYCTTQLEWEVVFDYRNVLLPPDIILGPNIQGFNPHIETVKAFHEWSIDEPSSLSSVIEELLELLREHQQMLITSNQRLQFELNSLVENTKYSKIDVWTSGNVSERSSVFYISMDLDFSSLPTYITKDNPGMPTVTLIVKFLPPDSSRVVPSLLLSPSAEKILSQPKAPTWGSDNGTCLMDYIPLVAKHLDELITNIRKSYKKRQEYVAALLSYFGRAVLEYDIERYMYIYLLFDHKGFFIVINLELSEKFPQKQPVLKLRSVYHRLQGQPCQSVLDAYPYNQRWSVNTMVEKLRDHLLEMIPKFQQLSVKEGQWIT